MWSPKKKANKVTQKPHQETKASHRRGQEKKSTLPAKIINAQSVGIHPQMISHQALKIVDKLQANGFEAYIVGGCLRDLLQGKRPKDFDVATNARPEQIKDIFKSQCRLVGRRFRLAHILFGRDFIEVATFRANHSDKHNGNQSRQSEAGMLLRDNVYGTLEEDAVRRDFTVNAFYYDPKNHQLIDFFNGLDDLKVGKLRLIGDPIVRYQEDPVRMLRAVRFMAKLDMFLDEPSHKPIAELRHLLKQIPPARLYDESLKLLQSGSGFKTYELLRQYGLFEQLFPTLMPYFTDNGDNFTERMIKNALMSTDERLNDQLPINPAFLFAAIYWYPLREKVELLKNEGGLNNQDAYNLACNDLLALFCQRLSAPRRHTAVIRDIWALQLQLYKRHGKTPQRTFQQSKFRAAFDLLALRAEIEGGESIELLKWWHAYQLSNDAQRIDLIREQQKHHPRNQLPRSRHRRPRRKTLRQGKES